MVRNPGPPLSPHGLSDDGNPGKPCGSCATGSPRAAGSVTGGKVSGVFSGDWRRGRGCGWKRLCGTQPEGGRREPSQTQTVRPNAASMQFEFVLQLESSRARGPSTWTEPVGRSRAGPSGAERRRAGPSGAESRGTARVTARRLRESRLAEALGVGGGEAALEVL